MGHHETTEEKKLATRKEMAEARVPLAYRDSCGSILISLNECRRRTFYMPWKCVDLRHAFEKCEYIDYLKRIEIQKEKIKNKTAE